MTVFSYYALYMKIRPRTIISKRFPPTTYTARLGKSNKQLTKWLCAEITNHKLISHADICHQLK